MRTVFGSSSDTIQDIERRAMEAFPYQRLIVWEGDPATFAFHYVGGDAEELLGYTAKDWMSGPAFWSERIVHSEDRNDAVAYCALATARGVDHVFEYRALTRDFNIVWLKDYVHVIRGSRGVPVRLRGLMFDVSDEKWASRTFSSPATFRLPAEADLR